MNTNRLKKLRDFIDNSKMLLKKAEKRYDAQKAAAAMEIKKIEESRDGQLRKAQFLINEFRCDFISDGCTVAEIPKRFYRFQKRLRKEITDKTVLMAMMKDLDALEKRMAKLLADWSSSNPQN